MQISDRPGLSGWERLALAALFLGLVIFSGIVVRHLGTDDDIVVGPPEDRPSVGADVSRPVPLLDAYEVAAVWANTWNAGAWPILVSSRFEFPPDADVAATPAASEGAYTFTFAAPKEDGAWPRLTLAVGRGSGVIYFEDALTSEVRPPESIDGALRNLPLSAGQAFRVAMRVVGQDYRAGCAAERNQVQVALDTTSPGEPVWVVVFFDQRERHTNDIVMRIDARTGATTTEQRDETSCAMPGE